MKIKAFSTDNFGARRAREVFVTKEMPTGSLVVNVSKDVSPERLFGFMTALWATMRWDNEYYLKNDIYQLYLARKKYRPDTL